MSLSIKALAQSGSESDQRQLATANCGFGFRLLKELALEKPHATIFISPYSISSVLQMLNNGARGQTRTEMQQVLGTSGLSVERMNSAYQSLGQSISSTESNAILNLANALWYRTGAQLDPAFAAVNEKFYGATLGELDFGASHSAQVMNNWAAQNTRGKIKTIIQPPIPPDTTMIVANAIYFKGTWLDQFDPKQTKQGAFHLANGSEKQTPLMAQNRTFVYQEGAGFQAVQLPYSGNRLEMEVLLPDTGSSVETLAGKMDEQVWQDTILPAFHERRGTLVLPRFRLRFGADLKRSLTALGLKSAWTQSADFSGMSPARLFISEVKHQSFVEVNEQGTEAAAVTTGVVALASVRNHPPPFEMIVNRPFLFAISDRVTRSILFMGLVFEPDSAED